MLCKVFCLLFFVMVSVIKKPVTATKQGSDTGRFLLVSPGLSFTTFTVLKVTTTSTSTFTSTTTCTTSTATLSSCTTGRRRRGLFYDESKAASRSRRSEIFYNEDFEKNNDGVFLPVVKNDPTIEVINQSVENSNVFPLQIESGFSLPEGSHDRFLLSFGTSTVTSLVISYSTVSLTAICSSTTGFPLCGGAGK